MNFRFGLGFILAGAILILPTAVEADHPAAPFAGFVKARHGKSLRVWVDPYLKSDTLSIVAPWNQLAQWELFVPVSSRDDADITFDSAEPDENTGTGAIAVPSYDGPFTGCVVVVAQVNDQPGDLQHEIGHCLGFDDHTTDSGYGHPNYNSRAICSNPSHRFYRRYSGIMSECDWNSRERWFGPDDRSMLIKAGYHKSKLWK